MRYFNIKISDDVYDRFMRLLCDLNDDKIEINELSESFVKNREYLHKELERIDSGDATFLSQNELDDKINAVLE